MIYAINTGTKEHRLIGHMRLKPQGVEWKIAEADAEGWIPWDGGVCPLPDDCRVEIKTRSGYTQVSPRALSLYWKHNDRPADIITYRPILDAALSEPEVPEWDGEGLPPVGLEVEVYHEGRWIGATTIGLFRDHKDCMVCAPDGGGFFGFYPEKIRPIRSAEDKAVEEMVLVIGQAVAGGAWSSARALYRAGYRKGNSL